MNDGKIIQITPCVKPMVAVYRPHSGDNKCGDNKYYFSWAYYIGLTDAGIIVPIDLLDGYLQSAEDMSNFSGAWYGPEGLDEEPFYEQMKEWMEENKP